MIARNLATERQVQAARPDVSTWLSANAGSGKTRVLTDRVARLLLDGVSPENILCLTYTKAAASEMQNRLFQRLGEWAMKPNESLREELQTLGVERDLHDTKLAQARTLFASAIETPGGLKIQTIHSFCAALLRRFPLEARVSPQFTEMEDRAGALLRADIVNEMAEDDAAFLVQGVARYLTDESFESLTEAIVGQRSGFAKDMTHADFMTGFDVSPELTLDQILDQVFQPDTLDLLSESAPIFKASDKPTDQKHGSLLTQVTQPSVSGLITLEKVFLYGGTAKAGPFSAKIGKVPTKDVAKGPLEQHMEALDDLMVRVETARWERLAITAAERSFALHQFAREFLGRYERHKTLRGWLDFDDLIARALDLLSDRDVANWVLYRLDGKIDHILVDEAQDTSPLQWQVIERLADEFTSGDSARSEVNRTIFVVGDKKQSIYSFQGADPREFDRMRDEFATRFRQINAPFQSWSLDHSFRSSSAVLQAVDATFRAQVNDGVPQEIEHIAFKDQMPGRVDLWPVVEKAEKPEDVSWKTPVDRVAPTDHNVILANRVAAHISALITSKTPIPDTKDNAPILRPVHAGDILILVQRRSTLFEEIIRACKQENLPIAGADRLKVGAELAVKDLAALLRVLATPVDDLSLAEVLKSPLFGWDEQRLFTLARDRKSTLWRALTDTPERYETEIETIRDLRDRADYLRPFDLIERILTRHDGRRKLLGRLGAEAEDGINALLTQALAFERDNVPSLTGFLQWMETDELEIKRQMEEGGERIRVMTVHGAKGLEAPIVILPDTGQRQDSSRGMLIGADPALWKVKSEDMPRAMTELVETGKESTQEERERLLYVAMTRAEKWLIVAGAGEMGKSGLAWHERVSTGLTNCGAVEFDFGADIGTGLRFETGDWTTEVGSGTSRSDTTPEALDPVFSRSAPAVADPVKPLSPSDLGGAKALAADLGQDQDIAMRRGNQIHTLLEHLPDMDASTWAEQAERILDATGLLNDGEDVSGQITEATRVLQTPGFAHLFTADALAEVPVTACLPELAGRRLHGIIDRLLIDESRILAVDFKTNMAVPETPIAVPDGLLRQMGAYGATLREIYPNHQIETAILWTSAPKLMALPHDLVTGALETTIIP